VIPRLQECPLGAAVPIANLAKHPAHGLVDRVAVVVQEEVGDPERVVEFQPSDEVGPMNTSPSRTRRVRS
jgi:hypothetical protein